MRRQISSATVSGVVRSKGWLRGLLAVFATTLFLVPCRAQQVWSLRDCIEYAVENNIDISQLKLNVENSALSLNTARNSRLPDLSASAGQSFSFGQSQVRRMGTNSEGQQVESIVYENIQTGSTSMSVSSSVPIFGGFSISNQIKSNALNLKAAVQNLNKAKENLELQIASYYLDVLFKKEILALRLKQAERYAADVGKTVVMVEVGKAPLSQQYEIEAQLARAEQNVVTARNDLDMSLLTLAQSINIPDPHSFDIEPANGYTPQDAESYLRYAPAEIYEMALHVKPHIREMEYRLLESEMDVKIAKGALMPSLSMGMSYNNGFNQVFGSDNESISSQLRKRGNEYVGLNLSIPIFNRMATRNRIRIARLSVENTRLAFDQVKMDIYKEIRLAHQGAHSASAAYTATEKALVATQEALRYVQERYDMGKATVYELNESMIGMLASASEMAQARYELMFRSKILAFYMGLPIDIP